MKKSKHPVYDDPSAFKQRFPRITPDNRGTLMGKAGFNEQCYKMGPIACTLTVPQKGVPGYFMSVHGRDHYPTWDEIVWLRYNLIPDSARMALILPNLNAYINQDNTAYKFVFTMEQQGWALDPVPTCPHDGQRLELATMQGAVGNFTCICGHTTTIDMATWNERHGNGFLGERP